MRELLIANKINFFFEILTYLEKLLIRNSLFQMQKLFPIFRYVDISRKYILKQIIKTKISIINYNVQFYS